MKLKLFLSLFLMLSLSPSYAQKAKIKRADGFFGLHFDFHASLDDKNMGETLTEGMIDSLLTQVKPDFVQIDCKGHGGISSYPTKVGTPVSSFAKNSLQLWRNVTEKHGVSLLMHFSGVWDNQAAKLYPKWARVNEKGEIDKQKMSVFSPYKENLLLGQLKELSKEYKIDGAWVDGECWAVVPDYSAKSLEMFRKETGITTVPKARTDAKYYEFMEFNRKSFRTYVKSYIDEIHRFDPNFQVTSNWAFSSMMPEPVEIDLDFLSGDFLSPNAVYNAAFQARCLAPQGRPWDLMAWSFSIDWKNGVHTFKSVPQLKQEAAQTLAMGGAFQIYYTQNRDASIKRWQVPSMVELAKFCRERQEFCFKAKQIPQIGLLYSSEAIRRIAKNLYNPSEEEIGSFKGILNVLLDNQYSVEALMEHHLKGKMKAYPLIVVPEWHYLDSDFKNELVEYANQGGNLIIMGTKTVKLFENELGVKLGELKEKMNPQVSNDLLKTERFTGLVSDYQSFTSNANTLSYAPIFFPEHLKKAKQEIITIANYGKGKIAGVYVDLGQNYLNMETAGVRNLIGQVTNALFPAPIAEVKGSHLVHVVANEKDNRLLINLVNTGGNHRSKNNFEYDEIPPLQNLTVKIKVSQKPAQVNLLPENRQLDYFYSEKEGAIFLTLGKLEIHSVIEVK
jgi:hypothetical protein